jgi:AcrR family transcriptional regulator
MMEEMRFEDIRVSELCERAMIRKSTFYKHFGDKYELLAFIVRQAQEKFNAKLAEELIDGERITYYNHLISLVCDFFAENKSIVHSALKSNSLALILSILSDQIMPDIREKLKEDERNGEKLPATPEVMTAFFVGGLMETARFWIGKGKPIDDPSFKTQIGNMLVQFYSSASE